jgi:hypothetical protein
MNALLSSLLSALVGALIVYVFGIRTLSIEIRNAFVQKQLSEFYSPIAGYRKRIQAKREIQVKIALAADAAWNAICVQRSHTETERLFAPYKSIIEYDNKQLREELMPLYRKMLDLFTEKYWLADEDTRAYYQNLLEFVEIWERYLAEALPDEVLAKLGHTEENVLPLYEHIENRLSTLQAEIKDQGFWKLRL